MEQLTRKAYAKINLGLDVLRRRPDGYHEVKMIMQTVDIYDTLTFRKLEERELSEKEKSSTEPVIRIYSDHETLPCNKSNLIYKAAALVMKIYEIKSGVAITLEKRIPIAAGGHRRLHHRQRPASGEPERQGGRHHRRGRLRAHPGQRV